MRLMHEVIRRDLAKFVKSCEELKEGGKEEDVNSAKGVFTDLKHLITIHMTQENDSFFPLLDKLFEGAATKAGFFDQHEGDLETWKEIDGLIENAIEDKCSESAVKDLQSKVQSWAESHEKHLKGEEDVMMPLTPKTHDTLMGRARYVNAILKCEEEEFLNFQLPHSLKNIVESGKFPQLRLFTSAIQYSSTKEEYENIKKIMKDNVGEKNWEKLVKLGLNEDGKLDVEEENGDDGDDGGAEEAQEEEVEEGKDKGEDYDGGHVSIHKTVFKSSKEDSDKEASGEEEEEEEGEAEEKDEEKEEKNEDDDVSSFFTKESSSLLKKYLTQEMYDELKDKTTATSQFTLQKAIQSGIDNQDSSNGVYAGDEESYSDFAAIFDPIIEEYHGGYTIDDKHRSDMDVTHLVKPEMDLDDYVISTRIRVGRNIRGYGLSPGITNQQREEVESLVTKALERLEDDLSGAYYPLDGMSEDVRTKLVEDHFLFKKGDRFLESCGANRNWPKNRGIYHNNEKTFLVWVNEEDQTRIISMQKGGDFVEVFERLARGIKAIEDSIKETAGKEFIFSDHLGYIHSCPTNLGTGMRASVHIKLPKLSATPGFKQVCADLKLQPRGVHGEHSETVDGIYDISNKHRIGYTEVELVQTMIDGVQKLIKMEQEL